MTIPIADSAVPPERARVLPKGRMPQPREDRRGTALISLLLHLLVVVLLISPFVEEAAIVPLPLQAAKGAGPAGGGGGGRRGTGGQPDQVRFVTVVPVAPPPPPTPKPVPVVPPPVPVVTPPPEPVKPPDPPIEALKPIETKIDIPPAAVAASSVVAGVGGGSGKDGSRGDGPGSGGGVGSGVGTGRGSGTGSGTGGGGKLDYYPPSPTEIFLPPIPFPGSVRGQHVIAQFNVDSTGRVVGDPIFNKTKDKDYNNKLVQLFKSIRFRPAVRVLDGAPVSAKAEITFTIGGF